LSGEEIAALTKALAAHEDQQAANIIRLLILTGARKGEVLSARWEQFDLQAGVWTKPGATTKQKTTHRVPLSKAACELLEGITDGAETKATEKDRKVEPSDFVFPGRTGGHRVEIKTAWRELCVAAGLVARTEVRGADGLEVRLTPTARIHDLRHTYASLLVSSGLSLPIVGALLGHTQPATTHRYSHLMDNPLRAATERVGALVMPATEPVENKEGEPA
ncbi:MAG: site-specific integrase, partial [Lentisphaeria bacterium]|nr:site-specific integrase [Lentisphaeria bacterium]